MKNVLTNAMQTGS